MGHFMEFRDGRVRMVETGRHIKSSCTQKEKHVLIEQLSGIYGHGREVVNLYQSNNLPLWLIFILSDNSDDNNLNK